MNGGVGNAGLLNGDPRDFVVKDHHRSIQLLVCDPELRQADYNIWGVSDDELHPGVESKLAARYLRVNSGALDERCYVGQSCFGTDEGVGDVGFFVC